jgi:hypothetical protein
MSDRVMTDGPIEPALHFETSPAAASAVRSVSERLFDGLDLEDDGDFRRRHILRLVLSRMTEAPRAQDLARSFLAEGVPATLRFGLIERSGLHVSDGSSLGCTPGNVARREKGHVDVTLYEAYLSADLEYSSWLGNGRIAR